MKPPRTLGVSLAILASVMLFTVLPLLQVAAPVLIQYRLSQVELPMPDGSGTVSPVAVGGGLEGWSNGATLWQLGTSALFFVIAIGAWLGRPRWIRGLMIAAVLILLALTVITSVATLNDPPDINSGLDSSQSLTASLIYARLAVSGLVTLYVLWYLNRGPARAFYRGYYLQRGEPTAPQN
ncbi:MAG: hypothetical protein J0M07_09775 [Anaerolineae bacterium]|nr:hypothetical protein [Anaerolineae bacterium]